MSLSVSSTNCCGCEVARQICSAIVYCNPADSRFSSSRSSAFSMRSERKAIKNKVFFEE